MLNIGFSELLLFGIIALVILGPDKLPTAVRTAGRWYARLRHMVSNLQQDIEKELQLAELREHMEQELARIKTIEAQMQAQLDQMSDELAGLNPASDSASHLVTASRYVPATLAFGPLLGVPYTAAHVQRQVQQPQPSMHPRHSSPSAPADPIPEPAL